MFKQLFRPSLNAVILWALCITSAFAEGELQYAELGDCKLESGEVIHDCRIAYRTLGQLNEDRSNVMVFPSWYTGSSKNLVDFGYIGPAKIADTDRYYVIAVDALGNGVSSSPSNSAAQPLEQFPRISIGDMVNAQYRLLTEKLKLDHVEVVLGASMGGFQVFEWMVRYPGFMHHAVAIEGTPWPTSHDLLLWSAWMQATEVYDGSDESLRRSSILLAQLDGLTLWTPGHFNSLVDPAGFAEFMQGFTPQLDNGGLFDRKVQTRAALDHDVSRGVAGFVDRAADVIKARVLVVVFSRDHMVNPAPSLELAAVIGASTVVLDSPCGHMAPNAECNQAEVAQAVNAFLSE